MDVTKSKAIQTFLVVHEWYFLHQPKWLLMRAFFLYVWACVRAFVYIFVCLCVSVHISLFDCICEWLLLLFFFWVTALIAHIYSHSVAKI